MQAVAIDLLKGYQINYRGHGYEILQGNNAGVHSYRLNQKDRLDFTDENGILTIQSCKGHHNIWNNISYNLSWSSFCVC